jgi:hypothetical protein
MPHSAYYAIANTALQTYPFNTACIVALASPNNIRVFSQQASNPHEATLNAGVFLPRFLLLAGSPCENNRFTA